MGIKEFLDLGEQALAAFKDHTLLLLGIIVIAAIVGAGLQRWVDGGESRKLKAGWDGEVRRKNAEISALNQRFKLVHEKQERLTEEIDQQRANGAKLEREVAELKTELARVKVQVPTVTFALLDKQLEKVASSSAVIANTVTVVSTANSELGRTLTSSGSTNEARGSPAKPEA
jgi:septal ring factor EnvC (AmiA/AmiB activator)